MWRRFLRWLGVSHEGPIRVKAAHWWQWRRANRMERYLNWQSSRPEFQAELARRMTEAILFGTTWPAPPEGFYGRGIGEMLEERSRNGTN